MSPGPGGEGGGKIVQVEEALSEETGDGGGGRPGGRALRKPLARLLWAAMGWILFRCWNVVRNKWRNNVSKYDVKWYTIVFTIVLLVGRFIVLGYNVVQCNTI